MSFLKKLFGGGNGATPGSGAKPYAEIDYEGFKILATPMEEAGQFRVCALIRKESDGEVKEHKLIRADICSTKEEASDIAIRKARQMIDERGEGVFA